MKKFLMYSVINKKPIYIKNQKQWHTHKIVTINTSKIVNKAVKKWKNYNCT